MPKVSNLHATHLIGRLKQRIQQAEELSHAIYVNRAIDFMLIHFIPIYQPFEEPEFKDFLSTQDGPTRCEYNKSRKAFDKLISNHIDNSVDKPFQYSHERLCEQIQYDIALLHFCLDHGNQIFSKNFFCNWVDYIRTHNLEAENLLPSYLISENTDSNNKSNSNRLTNDSNSSTSDGSYLSIFSQHTETRPRQLQTSTKEIIQKIRALFIEDVQDETGASPPHNSF